tara:strand:+ start:1471 stop:1650 length:180 start_codon:yes stop_codon:yes gene_type:complete
MKKQTTIHISFPEEELKLFNELRRVSAMTYTPTSMLMRQLCREGLEHRTEKQKLTPVLV